MYPPPLKFPTTTKAAFHDALPHEDQFQQFGIDFAFNPTKSNQSIRDQESRSPRTASASDINMHESYADAESNHWQSKGKRSAIQNQAINESHALQSVIAQLNRIELRGASGASKEDVQRLETSCASKANVESLEIRVQHLEKAIHRLPGSDQMPESHEEIIMKMVNLSLPIQTT